MHKILKSQKRVKKYNANRFTVCLLAVLMLFSALSTGSITVHAETPVAQIGETTYISLAEAITEAGAPATSENAVEIKMLANITLEADVTTGNYIFLNLNGYTLDLSGSTLSIYGLVSNNGKVVDSSNGKTGLLKASSFVATAKNGQMPVYNTEKGGYMFADIEHQELDKSDASTGTFKLVFKPYFGAEINKLLKSGSVTTGVNIGIRLEWTDANDQAQSKELWYSDAMVQEVYTNNRAFYIEATGVGSFSNLKITPLVESKLGTECLGDTTYEGDPTIYYETDHENSTYDDSKHLYGNAKAYSLSIEQEDSGNKYFKLLRDGSTCRLEPQLTDGVSIANELIVEIDLKPDSVQGTVSTSSDYYAYLQYKYNGSNNVNLFFIYNNNEIKLKDNMNSTTVATLTEGTWTKLRFVINPTSNSADVYVYDETTSTYIKKATNSNLKPITSGNPTYMRLNVQGDAVRNLYVDNFKIYQGASVTSESQ